LSGAADARTLISVSALAPRRHWGNGSESRLTRIVPHTLTMRVSITNRKNVHKFANDLAYLGTIKMEALIHLSLDTEINTSLKCLSKQHSSACCKKDTKLNEQIKYQGLPSFLFQTE
jgi:hypothetical protein